MRTLFILIALVLAVVIIKRLLATKPRKKTSDATPTVDYKPTVRCEYCGAHVPSATALNTEKRFFCDNEHYLAYKSVENTEDVS